MTVGWKAVLEAAAGRAQSEVDRVEAEGRRGEYVGVGASGDRTLLADKRAEDAIVASLSSVEGLRFLAEEGGESGERSSTMVAVVDPLDGSSNFQRGIPFYCTSIAIADGPRFSSVVAGVVRNLVNGDVYYCEKGRSPTKNGIPLRVGAVTGLREATVGVDLSRTGPEVIGRASGVVLGAQREVHLGSNCLEMCLLAEGSLDAFVDIRKKMRAVDLAAASLIARSAGATITAGDGSHFDPLLSVDDRFSVVASGTPALHQEIVAALRK